LAALGGFFIAQRSRKISREAWEFSGKEVVRGGYKMKSRAMLNNKIRSIVIIRDNYTCQLCHKKAERMSKDKSTCFERNPDYSGERGSFFENDSFFGTSYEFIPFEIDHKVPICKGGTDHIGNLQLLCRRCNRKKGKKELARAQ
jgi:5-methylcytosine-specific restriction endonuclease McrA